MNENDGTREYVLEFKGLLSAQANDDKEAVSRLLGMVSTEDIYTWQVRELLRNGNIRIVEEL